VKAVKGTRYVPSENVFVDRYIRWTSSCFQQFQVTLAALPAVGESVVVPGRDFSLCAFPLNSLCSTLTSTINDTTSVINTQDVLQQVLRLCDKKGNRLVRTCPTMLDKYRSYNDAFGTVNNPIGGEDTATDYDNVPNGAWPNLVFTDSAGNPLPLAPTSPAFVGATYDCAGGVPSFNAGGTAPAVGPHQIYIRWQTTEPLVLSPFVFADEHEYDTGLFGINNIQLIMNLSSSPSRVIRSTTRAGRTITNVAYNTAPAQGAFQGSRVDVQFLTPALSVPLPAKSVVPYMEFPRYISTPTTIPAGSTLQVSSQTITLPQIPDLLIIYAKPAAGYGATDADFLFPIASRVDGVTNPLTVNFDNFSGLLSSHTAEELYAMSVKNGVDMDYASWVGSAHSAAGSYPGSQQGQRVPLVGGPLVIKPSQDLTLQSGQAPSLVGNFTLQFNVTLKNTGSVDAAAQLYVITANSGFFESIRGSSRIIKGVLSEQDIIAAAEAPPMTRMSLDRMVGGISFGSLANALSKAKEIYHATKPAISAVKGMLGDEGTMGKVKGALGAVGYGQSGGMGMDGCGPSGGARTGGRARKSLAARLM